jgi:hypothetical protein
MATEIFYNMDEKQASKSECHQKEKRQTLVALREANIHGRPSPHIPLLIGWEDPEDPALNAVWKSFPVKMYLDKGTPKALLHL